MLIELAHPIKFVGDFEDFGPTHELFQFFEMTINRKLVILTLSTL